MHKYKHLGAALLMIGMTGAAMAGVSAFPVFQAPEIDPVSAAASLTLLAGVLAIVRGRRATK
jgi:hypothetical protein